MIYFGVTVVSFIVGVLIGAGVVGYVLRCSHSWEKIVDDKNSYNHVVIHMCTKCGKKITTKTDLL